jgi:hypothetical protein
MEQIKRYRFQPPPVNEEERVVIQGGKHPYGGFVLYEDHERIVKELEARCERLNRECQSKALTILEMIREYPEE